MLDSGHQQRAAERCRHLPMHCATGKRTLPDGERQHRVRNQKFVFIHNIEFIELVTVNNYILHMIRDQYH